MRVRLREARACARGESRQHLILAATQIKIDGTARGIAEDDNGLRSVLFRALGGEGDVKAKLLENTQSAVERGAFGSPTFFVGNEIFFGKEQLREVEELVLGK